MTGITRKYRLNKSFYAILCHFLPFYAIFYHFMPFSTILCYFLPFYAIFTTCHPAWQKYFMPAKKKNSGFNMGSRMLPIVKDIWIHSQNLLFRNNITSSCYLTLRQNRRCRQYFTFAAIEFRRKISPQRGYVGV